jgi:hypothetical protein
MNAIQELSKAKKDDKSILVREAASNTLDKLAPKFGYDSVDALIKASSKKKK